MTTQRDMLITCRDQFALYAQNHRAKASRFSIEKAEATELHDQERLAQLILDTTAKAEVNEQFCRDIQAVLDQGETDVLTVTAQFPIIVYDEGITPKNQQTQLGVHFEEVAEMVEELSSDDIDTQVKLYAAANALEDLAAHLKNSEPGLLRIIDRTRFLDSICDQLVTATVGAVLYGMDPVGGLREVNRSNYSKLIDGRMEKVPVSQKWVKGPNYTEPNLSPFV